MMFASKNLASNHDGSVDKRAFRRGDIVRSHDNTDNCAVIGTWDEWIWLDPLDYRYATPFTGRSCDYDLVRPGDI
jgi:hypothetical protein